MLHSSLRDFQKMSLQHISWCKKQLEGSSEEKGCRSCSHQINPFKSSAHNLIGVSTRQTAQHQDASHSCFHGVLQVHKPSALI